MKVTKETIIRVNWKDFETFVNKEYGIKGWDFVQDQECGNDISKFFDVDGRLDKGHATEIRDWRTNNGNRGYKAYMILNDLASKGKIEKGIYCIDVCW